MTVTPERIVEMDKLVADETFSEVRKFIDAASEAQPALIEFLAHKFGRMSSPHALYGVTLLALALVHEDHTEKTKRLLAEIDSLKDRAKGLEADNKGLQDEIDWGHDG